MNITSIAMNTTAAQKANTISKNSTSVRNQPRVWDFHHEYARNTLSRPADVAEASADPARAPSAARMKGRKNVRAVTKVMLALTPKPEDDLTTLTAARMRLTTPTASPATTDDTTPAQRNRMALFRDSIYTPNALPTTSAMPANPSTQIDIDS